MARNGPQLRSPSGGYFAAAANCRASAALLIIGAMMASAPKSSARETRAKSLSGTRTAGADSAWLSAPVPAMSELVSQRPCWASSTTAAKPSRAIVSATMGEPSMHQAPKTVSPARRRLARAKATSAALLDLRDRLRQQFGHPCADLLLGDAFRLQILDELVRHVLVGAFLKIGEDDLFRIGFRVVSGFAQDSRRPQPQHLVPARRRLESECLVMRELLLEAFLALVERRDHVALVGDDLKIACTCSLFRPCISPTNRQGNMGLLFCGEITKWKT